MTANNSITDLLGAPLGPDWTVEGLAEQVLGAIAAQGAEEAQEFVLDADATTDRQSLRLLRPLLACLATKSAAEAGTPANLYGGHFSFMRLGPKGPVWILGQFENRPGSVRVTLRRSSSPPDVDSRMKLLCQVDDLELHGFGLVRSYGLEGIGSEPGLEWFRATVGDVRDSMKSELVVGIGQIEVYKTLLVIDKKRGTQRQRRGVVAYGAKLPASTLYITEEGIGDPRVRYEEVAHCLLGRIALDAPVFVPITDHAAIYTSFLQSRSFSECSPREKQLAVEIAARLNEHESARGSTADHHTAQAHIGEVVLRLPRLGIVQSADMLPLAS